MVSRLGELWRSRFVGARCPTRLRFQRHAAPGIFLLYLLYLDDSGSVKNPNEQHFVLAGIAVFERQIYHLISTTDEFVSSLNLGHAHDVELHGSVMASGKKTPWKAMRRRDRLDTIERGLDLLRGAHWAVRAFAVVVDKHADSTTDPVEYAFEEICNRFNLFLARLWRNGEGQQRGLIVMDKWHYEEALAETVAALSRGRHKMGHASQSCRSSTVCGLCRFPPDSARGPAGVGGLETLRA